MPPQAADNQALVSQRAFHQWRLGIVGTLSGEFAAPSEPAFGPPASAMRSIAGIDTPDPARASHWLDEGGSRSPAFTVGYAWRQLHVERSAFSRLDHDRIPGSDPLKLDSSSTRLSYHPAPGWAFQVSRGNLGSLDQFNPADETRRTSISATYSRGGDWQTTVAWGRSVHAGREPSVGYLVESTARIGGADAIFGRLEQVRSDELFRQNDSAQRELFTLRKLTLGYYRDVRTSGPFAFDVGAFASRYFVPSSAASSYGSEPTTYMLFLRVRVR